MAISINKPKNIPARVTHSGFILTEHDRAYPIITAGIPLVSLTLICAVGTLCDPILSLFDKGGIYRKIDEAIGICVVVLSLGIIITIILKFVSRAWNYHI